MAQRKLVNLCMAWGTVLGAALGLQPARAAVPAALPAPTQEVVEGDFTLAPMGYIRFCLQWTQECAAAPAGAVEATPERLEQLRQVYGAVNRRIAPRHDRPGEDVWSLHATEGDCDDYAVQKRHELARLGWPPGALLLAAARTPRGEAHLVLVARTQAGNLVLDNRRDAIVPMHRANLRWLKMQSAQNPSYWVELRRGPAARPQLAPALPMIAAAPAPALQAPAGGPAFAAWALRPAMAMIDTGLQ